MPRFSTRASCSSRRTTRRIEFFNTDGKVSFEHSWFYWDAEEEAFFVDEGVSSAPRMRDPHPGGARLLMQYHFFEFVTADRDTVPSMPAWRATSSLFEERDRVEFEARASRRGEAMAAGRSVQGYSGRSGVPLSRSVRSRSIVKSAMVRASASFSISA